ncbi:uncharacterized protein LOC124631834 [Helicoverpa zea]|uniref:uncharacterized protein LOC124631834 n=1 Tax=Helicoverpa zea TaxID=7113 RepID=UPI001F55E37F|nr:uncharacterized protein LOC124631834 [Helicoverpa zea]
MKYFTVFCVLAVVSSAFGAPNVEDHDLFVASLRDDINVMADTRKLIEQLVENLQKSAQEALSLVNSFNAGILHEANDIKNKIVGDVQKFKNRVTDAVDNVMHRISNSSHAVKECVDSHRSAAATVFNNTLSNTLSCVDERISEVSKEIKHLMTIANEAIAAGSKALEDMKKCTGDSTNIWYAGTCLAHVAFKTQLKSAGFLGQSTVSIGRINLGIASLPAALEVCAGMQLIQTGIQTGKIIVDIGGCSASGVFNSMIGKPQVE